MTNSYKCQMIHQIRGVGVYVELEICKIISLSVQIQLPPQGITDDFSSFIK